RVYSVIDVARVVRFGAIASLRYLSAIVVYGSDCVGAGNVSFSTLLRRTRRSPLFPYATLFRSDGDGAGAGHGACRRTRCCAARPGGARGARSGGAGAGAVGCCRAGRSPGAPGTARPDRKSTRLNSSHSQISYAVFCLKKKTETR